MELLWSTLVGIFTTDVFFYCLLGVVAGMVIGTLPGLSATMGIAILTPLTFWPVSYTHLDVYKRQIKTCSSPMSSSFFAARRKELSSVISILVRSCASSLLGLSV